MKTKLPISTISYNTKEFLNDRLNELISSHKVQFYCYIEHKGEMKANTRDKDHIHLYIEPNSSIDTMDIQKVLRELDLSNPNNKPLGVMPFQISKKFADWYLYGKHDPSYLASKNEKKEFSYNDGDFVSSDIDYFNNLVDGIEKPVLHEVNPDHIIKFLCEWFACYGTDNGTPSLFDYVYKYNCPVTQTLEKTWQVCVLNVANNFKRASVYNQTMNEIQALGNVDNGLAIVKDTGECLNIEQVKIEEIIK